MITLETTGRVLHLTRKRRTLKFHFKIIPPTPPPNHYQHAPTLLPSSNAAEEQGPNLKCMKARFFICSICRPSRGQIAQIDAQSPLHYPSKGGESKWTLGWGNGGGGTLPIRSLSSISRPIIGTNSFVHFDLLTSELISFQLSFKC